MGRQSLTPSSPPTSSVAVRAPMDMEIPGCVIQLIYGELQGDLSCFGENEEALVEPINGSPPTHICRSDTELCFVRKPSCLADHEYQSHPSDHLQRYEAWRSHSQTQCSSGRSGGNTVEHERSSSEINLDSTDLTESEKTELLGLLTKFSDLFAPRGGPVGQTAMVKHAILTEGPPIRQQMRRVPEALKTVVDSEVTKMLEQGVVKPSSSPWSSPIVMVCKKDGSWHFRIDYRKLNSVTHHDAYPLPRTDSILDSLTGSTYFITLDLASGYWQVEVEEQDKEKTAFSTPKGHFEFNVMPFGLTNAPATFQRLMECVLAALTDEQCLIHLDDIVVFNKTFQEHLQRLTNVFHALESAGLKLKASKCILLKGS